MKTRFCPSPTGVMHLGNVRTALFNALLASHERGTFLLRIEDTDKIRSKREFAEKLQYDLRWLGLEWQEGPGVEGSQGPYWQSERQAIYDRYYQELQEKGRAYPCFCSEQQLKIIRKSQLAAGKPPRYPGTCRHLSEEEVKRKLDEGMIPVLRFHMPKGEEIVFEDLLRGVQRFKTDDIGDFIIRRTDKTAPFMYANAIDDALMGVTHVLRGDDHLTNTPRQLILLKTLNLANPNYIHISLIVGKDGAPLSKRHGSKSVAELREQGYLPEAIINYLARLGHYYSDNRFMYFQELSQLFQLENLSSSPARYDESQLNYWQSEAIQRQDDDLLWDWFGDSVHRLVPENLKQTFITAVKPNITFPDDAKYWAEKFFFDLEYDQILKASLRETGRDFFLAAEQALQEQGADFKAFSNALKVATGVKGKNLFMPLRLALTGDTQGPEMAYIFLLLGVERLKQRFETITALLKE